MEKRTNTNTPTLEKLELLKLKAEDFLKENRKAFIIDINDTYYFCDILTVGEAFLYVQNFKGIRAGQKEKIYWADVVKLEGYKTKEELQ